MLRDVQCELCPKACVIAPGQSGECRIRVNLDGRLLAVTYGHPCSIHVDPIEKKPLYHFFPGSGILSMATVGCNLHCKNCQNWEISQQDPEHAPAAYDVPVDRLIELAEQELCEAIAYTYSDPVVFYEYTLDACRAAKQAGLRNVLVTAGYVNAPPWRRLCEVVDAANIDLKAFSDAFYRDVCDATLRPVLDTLVLTKEAGVHLEVTNLLIPTLNDTDEMIRDLCRWVVGHLGRETPLHFSGFVPRYKMKALPPTPAAALDRAASIARAEGLAHVYIGNVLRPGGSDTTCAGCGRVLIERHRYTILSNVLRDGACPTCKTEVVGRWE